MLRGNKTGVAKSDTNLTGMPHCDGLRFVIVLIILDSLFGLVFMWVRSDSTSNLRSIGVGSFELGTLDLLENAGLASHFSV